MVTAFCLELYVELYSYSPLVDAREVGISEPAYIIDAQYLEDVLHSKCQFHVWCGAHIMVLVVLVWELEQCAGVQRVGAVLVAKVAEHSLEGHHLAPVELAYERNPVEYESVHVICEVPRSVLVVEELHGVHQ